MRRKKPNRGKMKRADNSVPAKEKEWDEMGHFPSCIKSRPTRSEGHNWGQSQLKKIIKPRITDMKSAFFFMESTLKAIYITMWHFYTRSEKSQALISVSVLQRKSILVQFH
jgi:hypothetical protein